MAVIVRHRCQRCGAASEGGQGPGAWIRCPSCQAILGFDWLGFFESPAYAAYLANATEASREGWPRYQAHLSQGEAAAARGEPAEALTHLRQAVECLRELTPFMYPPEVATDAGYREATLQLQAWWLLQCRLDPAVRTQQQHLEATLRTVDYRDPLPTLRVVTAILREQATRLGASDAPPDPDGMTPPQRARVWVGVMLGAWVRLLSADQRLELLRELHGSANVLVTGDPAAEELGLFVEMACPHCRLCSLQARAAPEWTCLGCFWRREAEDPSRRAAVQVHCPACRASLTLGAAEVEVACPYCGGAVRRLVETGRVVREYAQQIQAQVGAPRAPLPPGGAPGLPVTPANRRALAGAGLVRVGDAYGKLVPRGRILQLMRRTAEALGIPADELLRELRATAGSGPGRAIWSSGE